MRFRITRGDIRHCLVGMLAGLLLIALIGPQLVAAQATVATPAGAVDFSSVVLGALETVVAVVAALIYGLFSKYVKDAAARAQVASALSMFEGWAINKTEGAFKDRPMNVNVGNAAAASIVRNVLALGPAVLSRAGWDERALAKFAVGKLPGIDGAMDEATIDKIVAAAKAGPGASPPPTEADLAGQAMPLAEAVATALLPQLSELLASKIAAKPAA